ncbi:MAG TPA: histidine phosphatase family protein [Candidatus Limnocylindrales bacterium]
MTTVVHLLRHGEVFNPAGVLYGRLPGYQLSELGKRMAEAVAKWLAGREVTHVVSSPLERARETAAPIADEFRLPVVIDPRLIESDNRFEGLLVRQALRDPKYWWSLRNPIRPSWGEPYRHIAARMSLAVEAARRAADGHEAVCVSHQLPIWTLRLFLEQRRLWHDPRTRACELASLTSLVFDGGRLTEITYSEPAAHLGKGYGVGA